LLTWDTGMPRVAKHFVRAEVRHFDYRHKGPAMDWLKGDKG